MRCEIFHFAMRCRRTAALHVKIVTDVGTVLAFICSDDRAGIAEWGERLSDGHLVAAHPIDLPCRHPSAEWDDDGCVLPVTVDTLADLEVSEAVPA